jgi:hypothetical protein
MTSIRERLPQELPDGFRLRFATPDDAEAVAQSQQRIHHPDDELELVARWVRHLFSGEHPIVRADDFTLVEEVATGRVVSSMGLLSQTWQYGGVAFGFGMPELVATEPGCRRRGYVRRQFEALHDLSAERGELMNGIMGIPYFYRQFGYEMAMNLRGAYRIRAEQVDNRKSGATCRLRPVQGEDDSTFVTALYETACRRSPFSVARTGLWWNYEFRLQKDSGVNAVEWHVVEASSSDRLGYVVTRAWMKSESYEVLGIELAPGVSPLNVVPGILRELIAYGNERLKTEVHPVKQITGVALELGVAHPAYSALDRNEVAVEEPYGWYIRLPNLIAFLRHVRPALERNLLGTPAEGYTGEIRVSFYRAGIRFVLERGSLVSIDEWEPAWGDARFPDRTFTQLVCGRRRCSELAYAFVDCIVDHEASIVLDAMFPSFTGAVLSLY